MPLNEALTAFLTEMAEQGVKPIHESTPEEVRALTAGLSELFGTGPDMARVEDTTIPVDGGSIAARILVPTASPRGVFVYYHGGGWVIGGNVEEYDTLGRKLAARTGCAVVLVDYRLAPEHRYPVAVDDSYAALEWVAAHRQDILARHTLGATAGKDEGDYSRLGHWCLLSFLASGCKSDGGACISRPACRLDQGQRGGAIHQRDAGGSAGSGAGHEMRQ